MTRALRGSCKYNNIVGDKIIKEEDNDFQERSKLFTFEYLKNSLFKKISHTELKITTGRENILYYERKDGSKVYFSFFRVVNAGQQTDRKRMQIPSGYFGLINDNYQRNELDTYFFIGIYPTGEKTKPIFVILDNDGFSLNPQKSYSSLWINFNSLVIANNNGIHYAINKKNGNKYVCFTEKFWELVFNSIKNNDFTSIIDNTISYVNKNGVEEDEAHSNIIEAYDERRDAFIFNKKPKIKKNSNYRDLILYESKYTCSLCGKNITFKTNNGVMYFEAHHLIPCNFNMQQNYEKKLDSPSNMFCLCPECHRKIHFINDNEVNDLLEKLYNVRAKCYKDNYNLKIEDLIKIYKKIDRKIEEDM